MELKPGIKTTEFWSVLIGILANLVGVLVVLGWVSADDAPMLTEAIKAIGASVQLLVVNVLLIWRYISQREELKREELRAVGELRRQEVRAEYRVRAEELRLSQAQAIRSSIAPVK